VLAGRELVRDFLCVAQVHGISRARLLPGASAVYVFGRGGFLHVVLL
jgi:hypothetical protein